MAKNNTETESALARQLASLSAADMRSMLTSLLMAKSLSFREQVVEEVKREFQIRINDDIVNTLLFGRFKPDGVVCCPPVRFKMELKEAFASLVAKNYRDSCKMEVCSQFSFCIDMMDLVLEMANKNQNEEVAVELLQLARKYCDMGGMVRQQRFKYFRTKVSDPDRALYLFEQRRLVKPRYMDDMFQEADRGNMRIKVLEAKKAAASQLYPDINRLGCLDGSKNPHGKAGGGTKRSKTSTRPPFQGTPATAIGNVVNTLWQGVPLTGKQ